MLINYPLNPTHFSRKNPRVGRSSHFLSTFEHHHFLRSSSLASLFFISKPNGLKLVPFTSREPARLIETEETKEKVKKSKVLQRTQFSIEDFGTTVPCSCDFLTNEGDFGLEI